MYACGILKLDIVVSRQKMLARCIPMVRQHEAAILCVNYAHKMFYLPPLV